MPSSEPLFAELIGDPVAHSLSPRIFRRLSEHRAGIEPPIQYGLHRLAAAEVAAAFGRARSEGRLRGWNITAPHKRALLDLLDEVDGSARAIGAVNVVRFEKGRAQGFNTDAVGIQNALSDAGVSLVGARVRIFGAGGAARAAVVAAGKAARVVIVNRGHERAEALVADLKPTCPVLERGEAACEPEEILIQATSAPGSIVCPGIEKAALAFDLVYAPRKTAFLALAESRGVELLGGIEMLIHQAIRTWEIWQGRELGPADRDSAVLALREELFSC